MPTKASNTISFEYADFCNEEHCSSIATLINEYILDEMGGGKPLGKLQQLRLVDGLAQHPSCFVLLAYCNETIVGLATCFVNFSTFRTKPFLNIHDVIVTKDFRGKGIGNALIQRCFEIAEERGCCKITLEVRHDNTVAQTLYKKHGFNECSPKMLFWQRDVDSLSI